MAAISDFPFVRLPFAAARLGEAFEKAQLAQMAASTPAVAIKIELEGKLKAFIGNLYDKPGRTGISKAAEHRINFFPRDMLEGLAAKDGVEALNLFWRHLADIRLNMAF